MLVVACVCGVLPCPERDSAAASESRSRWTSTTSAKIGILAISSGVTMPYSADPLQPSDLLPLDDHSRSALRHQADR